MAFKDVYRNKRVLVTGHTGFKGAWLGVWLGELGAEVVGYALAPPSVPSIFVAAGLEDRLIHVNGDVRDLKGLLDVFNRYRPEFVFHLAAQALVRPSYDDPKATFDINVGGTVNILEAIRKTGSVRVLVNVTSDKCYENREWVWGYRENDPLGGHDPYSASKGCAELAFAAYLRSYFQHASSDIQGLGAASCRAGNVVGGGDWGRDRLLPDCVRALNGQGIVDIRNPRAVRPWQHVLEPLAGYLWLGAKLSEAPETFSGTWNFGPPNESCLSVAELVERFIRAWGGGEWQDISDPGAVHEAVALRLCCDKAASQLNWRNVLSIEETLALTAVWYRAFYDGCRQHDIHAMCVDQIRHYERLAVGSELSWAL